MAAYLATSDKEFSIILSPEIITQLINVFNVLKQPSKSLIDDTSLDKLYKLITAACRQSEDYRLQILSSTHFQVFLKETPLDHSDPQISAFALRLFPFINSISQGHSYLNEYGLWSVLEDVPYKDLWKSPSVRNAWFSTMANLSKNLEVTHIIQKICSEDITFFCKHFQDESIFVSKSCQLFMINLVCHWYEGECAQNILKWIINSMKQFTMSSEVTFSEQQFVKSLLFWLNELCLRSSIAKANVANLLSIETIITIGTAGSEKDVIVKMENMTELVFNLSSGSYESHGCKMCSAVNDVPKMLFEKAYFSAAILMTGSLVKRLPCEVPENLTSILLSPMMQMIHEKKFLLKPLTLSLIQIQDIFQKTGMVLLNMELLNDLLDEIVQTERYTPQVLKPLLSYVSELIEAKKSNEITASEFETIISLISLTIKILANLDLDQVVVAKAYSVIKVVVSSLVTSEYVVSVLDQLTTTILRGFCSMNWEVRDSTIELVAQMSKLAQSEEKTLKKWILDNHLCDQVLMSIRDRESYVRVASAKSILDIWWLLLEDEKLNARKTMVEIVLKDESNLVRRASIFTIYKLLEKKEIKQDQDLLEMMQTVMDDSDWEVKINGLLLWDHLLKLQLQDYSKISETDNNSIIGDLSQCGFISSLINAVHDCEPIVCEKAYLILINLKSRLPNLKLSDECVDQISDKLQCNNFIPWLVTANLDILLQESQQSSDSYIRNPVMLLEDILAVTNECEDNLLDCY